MAGFRFDARLSHGAHAEDGCELPRIKRRFGAKSALDYLIGEKLMMFADAARHDTAFARELPMFLAAVWHMLNQYEIAGWNGIASYSLEEGLRSAFVNPLSASGQPLV